MPIIVLTSLLLTENLTLGIQSLHLLQRENTDVRCPRMMTIIVSQRNRDSGVILLIRKTLTNKKILRLESRPLTVQKISYTLKSLNTRSIKFNINYSSLMRCHPSVSNRIASGIHIIARNTH